MSSSHSAKRPPTATSAAAISATPPFRNGPDTAINLNLNRTQWTTVIDGLALAGAYCADQDRYNQVAEFSRLSAQLCQQLGMGQSAGTGDLPPPLSMAARA